MFLSLDGTAIVQLVNFAIFFALLNVLFLKPVSRAIVARRKYIESLTSDYDTYQAEANAMRAQDERLRADARREAEQRIAKARADASNETARLATDYSAQVQTIVDDAQREVSGELAKARADSEQLVAQLSGIMVERAVGEVTR